MVYTEPEEAKSFVDQTGTDFLAVSIGTCHGVYKATPKLDIPRLREIRKTVSVKKVTHLACAHADKHLDELRAGHGEERYVCLTGDSLCKHRLAGSRRADEQHALRHGRADIGVFLRVMEVVHDLGEGFLCLVLTRDIVKVDALCGLDVDLRAGLARAAKHQRVLSAGAFHQLLSHVLADGNVDPPMCKALLHIGGSVYLSVYARTGSVSPIRPCRRRYI